MPPRIHAGRCALKPTAPDALMPEGYHGHASEPRTHVFRVLLTNLVPLAPPAMLAKNLDGKLPILEDGDFVLWESSAMLPYLASRAGRTELASTTLQERADVDR